MNTANDCLSYSEIIQLYDMQPHPEGGFFKETYRSLGEADTSRGKRSFSTAIYYLLPAGAQSRLHRIASDEMWHFYLGGPMTLIEIAPTGELKKTVLGHDLKAGELAQAVVPAGSWFGAYANEETEYAFVGCTVAPGFDFRDFEMGNRDNLLALYPHAREAILKLTR